MPRDHGRSPHHAETEETRRAILHAARDLFTKLGYRAVTTRMVAEASGVKQPLLYYHFADKEALYLEVQREHTAASQAALERIAARQNASVPERLRDVVHYLRQTHQQNMGLLFHEMRHEMSPQMQNALRNLFQTRIVEPITAIFEDGIRSGFLRSPAAGGISARMGTYLLLSSSSNLSTMASREDETSQSSVFGKEREAIDAIVHTLMYGMVDHTTVEPEHVP